jgi:circadian clock protein KaiC
MSKVQTKISNLDKLLDGGLIERSFTVLSGPTGSGKTLLGMQYLYNGIVEFDEPGMFITIEEGSETVTRMMTNYGMDFQDYITEGKLYMVDLGEVSKEGESKDKEPQSFKDLVDILNPLIKLSGAKRLVLDSIPSLGAYYKSSGVFRLSLSKLRRFLRTKNVTSILITESVDKQTPTRFGIEQYIADNFILLSESFTKKKITRYLEIRKFRLSKYNPGLHQYTFGKNGLEINVK